MRLRQFIRLVGPRTWPLATAWYTVMTVAMTWPVLPGLTRDIPADFGDPVLNCWILGWGADHLVRFFSGDLQALVGFWNANIFAPEPLALAYSEHLIAQVVQILPVYALTHNLILCYNLLFLSSFILSALGTYLLVRELTGSSAAAFLAGLVYGFAPFRVPQASHLQILSSQWMPFVLFGLRRYFTTRRPIALAGATVALVLQNLSCGYYLVFFAPFVAAYVLYEVLTRHLALDWKLWASLAVAGLIVAAATWPFLYPYMELRQSGFPRRSLGEILFFSATWRDYFVVSPRLHLWGPVLSAGLKAERELFPGAVCLAFAAGTCLWTIATLWRHADAARILTSWQRYAALALAAVVLFYLALIAFVLAGGHFTIAPAGVTLFSATRVDKLWGVLRLVLKALVVVLAFSPRVRRMAVALFTSPGGFYAAAAVAAIWLSFGAYGPYTLFYEHVPGFDGLRVPARYGVLALLFLATLGGLGAARLVKRFRWGLPFVAVCGLLVLVESTAAPFEVNRPDWSDEMNPPPPRVYTGRDVPGVYQYARTLPPRAILAEFPFGTDTYDVRYMFYSTVHWRRLVNGYSGGFPERYVERRRLLLDPLLNPGDAWRALVEAGTTHVIIHHGAYPAHEAPGLRNWLLARGARPVSMFEEDELFELPTAIPGR